MGEVLGEIDFDEWVALVVLEAGVVLGFVLLDEVGLEEEGFLLGLCDDVFEFRNARHHFAYLWGMVCALCEVRPEAVADLGCFADVQHGSGAAAHDVNTRLGWGRAEALGEVCMGGRCSRVG